MNEPAVQPAKPDTKPKPTPKRRQRPKPDRNNPWVVPKPKVNPTPKGKVMSNLKKKEVISDIREFKAFSSVMTYDAFFAKYTLSMDLVAKIAASKAMKYSASLDCLASAEDAAAAARL